MIKSMRILAFLIALWALTASWAFADKPPKIKVVGVTIEGNHVYSEDRLMHLMVLRPSSFFHKSNYNQRLFDDDKSSIVQFYQQNGYLDAKIAESEVKVDTLKHTARLSITIDEGPLTKVEGLAVFGNTVLSDSALLAQIKLKPGDAYKKTRVQDGLVGIISLYADRGFLDAALKPDIKINDKSHLALIDITVTEGRKYYIDNILIKGLDKTRKYVVTRELTFARGQLVSYSKLLDSQKKLYLTGLFESVFINPQPAADSIANQKDILIEIKERLTSEFNVSVGYGSVERARGRITLEIDNLAGTARQIRTNLIGSFIQRRAEIIFSEPWTLGLRLKTDYDMFYEYLVQPGFTIRHYVASLSETKSFGEQTTLTTALNFENAHLIHVEVVDSLKDFTPKTRSLTLSFINDTRDDIFNSSRGRYVQLDNEFASSLLRGSNSYIKPILTVKKFWPVTRNTVFCTALNLGWIGQLGKNREVPLNQRFYAGGPNSIRGFGYQLVGPLDENQLPIGGNFKIVWNALEIHQAIYKIIGAEAFVDIGNVWLRMKNVHLKDLRVGTGPGLRANTPIGIVRVDLGINVFPRDNESRLRLAFNIGNAF